MKQPTQPDREPLSSPSEASLSYEDLFRPFVESYKPPEAFRVGIEAERFGAHIDTGAPVHYDGPSGILTLFQEFVSRYGWVPASEVPGGPIIALQRGDASITLEPGGQLELSGSPMDNIHAVRAELSEHTRELAAISREVGLSWHAAGFHPTARQDELGWVPKLRYGIMRVYLAARGSGALDMMRRTATVQANFDYSSEEDALRKLRVGLRIAPIVSGMFANAPFVEGRPFGGKSYRQQIWLDVDPDRQGLLPRMWDPKSTLRDYVEWALDTPMFLITRGGRVVENTGQPFRSFMKDGFEGYRPMQKDWASHLNTLFPEVRLKRTLEVRGADSIPNAYRCGLPALWTGVLYDDQALERVERLTASWTYPQIQALRSDIASEGLSARFEGKTVNHVATALIEIAGDGLSRRGRIDERGYDEGAYLESMSDLVHRGLTPADVLLDGLPEDENMGPELLRRTRT